MTRPRPQLSPLEEQVLELVAAGLPNSLIRDKLRLSRRTLAQVLERLYRESGLHPAGERFNLSELRQRLSDWGRDYFARERGQ
jgi:DNA-binding NarL/FixJ family response regulator